MTEPIGPRRVRQLVDEGAQLVEVLPRGEYEEQHLPGAINIPLKELDADAVAVLDSETAVIVYCWDSI
jgi:rhodanese-related sulfurtransferase